MNTTINWDKPKLERFKKAYKKQTDKDAVFTFEGNEFLVGYAKYLIQFLDGMFEGKKREKGGG